MQACRFEGRRYLNVLLVSDYKGEIESCSTHLIQNISDTGEEKRGACHVPQEMKYQSSISATRKDEDDL
jgi:hypothetical protein